MTQRQKYFKLLDYVLDEIREYATQMDTPIYGGIYGDEEVDNWIKLSEVEDIIVCKGVDKIDELLKGE